MGVTLPNIAEQTVSYRVVWSKPGYGALPETAFAGGYPNGAMDVVLPPAPEENLVSNWGFEESALGPAWHSGGTIGPILTTQAAHSGSQGVLLGWHASVFTPPSNVSQLAGYSMETEVISGDDGALHVMWVEAAGASYAETSLYYARRDADGVWSEPVPISGPWSGAPQMALDQDGRVYAIWCRNNQIYFAQRSTEGAWSAPVTISNSPSNEGYEPRIAVDATGVAHVIWKTSAYQPPIYYANRSADGAWSIPMVISDPSVHGGWNHQLVIDAGGVVHAVWDGNDWISYAYRSAGGSWSPPQQIFHGSFSHLIADGSGVVHLVWTRSRNIRYAQKTGSGPWSQAETVYTEPGDWGASHQWDVAAESGVVVHIGLIPVDANNSVVHLRRLGSNSWAAPEVVFTAPGSSDSPKVALGSDGTFHLSWTHREEIYYARRSSQGDWSVPVNVSANSSMSRASSVVTDVADQAHVLWEDARAGATDVYHAQYLGPQQAGDSSINQQITLPIEVSNPTLSFMVQMQVTPPAPQNTFSVSIRDGTNTTTLWSTSSAPAQWTHHWFDLSPWSGRSISLVFSLNQVAGSGSTWAALDEISVGPGYPDIWAGLSGTNALPDQAIVYTITYGNRGGAAAASVRVANTLPAGLVFVSADPPPSSLGAPLTWDVGDLPGNSGPFTITLTARADPPVSLGSVTNTVTIQSESAEMETYNNTTRSSVFVGYRLVLPLIRR